ncbi:hypothetical protein C823_007609 [Eubacterium plexicaudatum ASF492]|uniref:Uncharacterized protein n=1 Tax=Eubacterium plexicaudatum ASF492 TaxID=1235802 RepID=N2AAP9_9FIRM|nr:hypothetical protein C823_007609 [Eubacterium plexicaudatum ASF492]
MMFIIILLAFNLFIIIILSNIKNPIKRLKDKDILRFLTEHKLVETSKHKNYDCDFSEVIKILEDNKDKILIKDINFYE